MKAKKKPVKELSLADLGIAGDAPKSELVGLEKVPERTGARMMAGDIRQAVEALVKILKEEEKVI
jgi:electron transfer flavoprotein beta subunit